MNENTPPVTQQQQPAQPIKEFIKVRNDTILASFIVALFASFLMALAFLLLRIVSSTQLNQRHVLDYFFNLYILIGLAVFVFFEGSHLAAWLVYRHDLAWGYKVEFKQILPIFSISFVMAFVLFFAIRYFITIQSPLFRMLEALH